MGNEDFGDGGGSSSSDSPNPDVDCDSSNNVKLYEAKRLYTRARNSMLQTTTHLSATAISWLHTNQWFDVDWQNGDYGSYLIYDSTLNNFQDGNDIVDNTVGADELNCN